MVDRAHLSGAEFDPERLLAAKCASGATVSVCLPALNVADTIGPILAGIRDNWIDELALVDELVVIDSHSSDHTARIARARPRWLKRSLVSRSISAIDWPSSGR